MNTAAAKMGFSPLFEVLSIEPINGKAAGPKNHMKSKSHKIANPYFLFCQERRTQIHVERPNVTSREVTQMLGQEWKALSQTDRQKYKDQYSRNLESYTKDKDKKTPIMIQFPIGNNQFVSIPAYVND